MTSLPLEVVLVDDTDAIQADTKRIYIIDIKGPDDYPKGMASRDAGMVAVRAIKKAVSLAMDGKIDGIVTAPVSKESLKLAGMPWPGHTEMLAELTGTDEYAMMFVSDKLCIILVTIHIPISRVSDFISREAIVKVIRLAQKGMNLLGVDEPEIGIAGLNPHAGESGILGDEEIRHIIPAIESAKNEGIKVSGPYPPDVIFYKAVRGDFDIVVCMYHDQGLIPFKMLAFDRGVNFTVGLPIVRTSPDHGCAFDIAWKNRADPKSMIEAIKIASRIIDSKKKNL
jgi:4-hydroxythreonine-4-phosphate dehydrogenase